MSDVLSSFLALRDYCVNEHFKGWDPYDGLNSRLFQSIPFLKRSAICRLIMIQLFKRSPINLRRLFAVPKDYNPKGVALFLQGYCNIYNILLSHPNLENKLGATEDVKREIIFLADKLIEIKSSGYSGACWGYNFDWQARRLFLFPKYTPTVVVTQFCATALMSAYEVTKDRKYIDTALSSSDFILNDLHRTPYKNGFLFSYSPLKGNDTVFNASLLGSRLLSCCYHYTQNDNYKSIAAKSIRAVCDGQNEDGSWIYGLLPVQSWIDSFHTGYNLDSLIAYEENTGDTSFHGNIEKGTEFYLQNFFEDDGCPKYYSNKKYPIDIHCPAQLFVTMARLHRYTQNRELLNRVMDWTIKNMQDKDGYFYYQLKKGVNSKIPYMRWSNAFMFYAMSYYLLNE
jgi:rhamnogalacturonyl hydrolase YesR